MNHQDYVDGHVTHEEYYRALAKALHIKFRSVAWASYFLNCSDQEKLAIVASYLDKAHAFRTFREFNDTWSTAGHLSALRQAAEDTLICELTKEDAHVQGNT